MRITATQLLSRPWLDGNEVRTWIYEATIEELEDFIKEASAPRMLTDQIPDSYVQEAQTTLQLRLAKAALNPHWSVVPNFWVTVVAAVAGVIAVWWGWHHDSQEQSRAVQSGPAYHTPLPALPAPINSPRGVAPVKR